MGPRCDRKELVNLQKAHGRVCTKYCGNLEKEGGLAKAENRASEYLTQEEDLSCSWRSQEKFTV